MPLSGGDWPSYQQGAGAADTFGTGKRILMQKIDVKRAFRQVGVDPAGAAIFGYVLAGYLFIDL